jgi:hypothetical protein
MVTDSKGLISGDCRLITPTHKSTLSRLSMALPIPAPVQRAVGLLQSTLSLQDNLFSVILPGLLYALTDHSISMFAGRQQLPVLILISQLALLQWLLVLQPTKLIFVKVVRCSLLTNLRVTQVHGNGLSKVEHQLPQRNKILWLLTKFLAVTMLHSLWQADLQTTPLLVPILLP